MPVRKKTPERLAQARALRESGLPYEAIGAVVGVSGWTVARWLDPDAAASDRAPSGTGKRARKKTPERVALAERLHEQGLNYQRIGALMGAAPETVARWLDPERARAARESQQRYRSRYRSLHK